MTRLETNLKYTDMAMWQTLSPERITKKNRSGSTKTVTVAVTEAARYCTVHSPAALVDLYTACEGTHRSLFGHISDAEKVNEDN